MNVGIVGAGITGLALTHFLAERGIDSVAFEAADQAGGVIDSREVDGHVLEVGPQRMRKTPGIAELANTAGVAEDIVTSDVEQLYVYSGGTLSPAPLDKHTFFTTDLLSLRGKARLLGEPLTRRGRPEETIEEVFTRKFGREAYERFIGPLYGGLYGSDPGEMPAAHALEGLLEREKETKSMLRAFRQRVGQGHTAPPITFEGGNGRLPIALAETYSDRIRLQTPVASVSIPDEDVETDSHEQEVYLEAAGETHHVDAVVLTTPAHVTARLLAPIADHPAAAGIEDLEELRYNPLALVYLQADHAVEGKGYQVGFDEELHTLGVSWNGQMFGRNGVQTAFLGGMHEPDLVEDSDERLGEIAAREFETVVGVEATVIDVARLDPGFPAWDHSWSRLADLSLPEPVMLATNYTGRMGIPSRVREARELAARLDS